MTQNFIVIGVVGMMTAAEQKIFFGIGRFAQMRYVYLRDHRRKTYDEKRRDGTLMDHLEYVQRSADEFMEREVERYLKKNPAPDQNIDFMGHVNHNIMARNIVEEFVRQYIIYPEEDRT